MYIRSTPDFFGDEWVWCGHGDATFTSGICQTFSLQNNDTLGRSLYIYAILIGTENSGIWYVQFQQSPIGTQVAAGIYANTSGAGAPGVLYYHQPIADFTNPFLNDDISNPIGAIGAPSAATMFSLGAPMWVVTPNNCIVVAESGGSSQWAITFWYVLLSGT